MSGLLFRIIAMRLLAASIDGGRRSRGSLRCKVGMHKYYTTTNDEGGKYLVCSRCGKESFPPPSSGPRIGLL